MKFTRRLQNASGPISGPPFPVELKQMMCLRKMNDALKKHLTKHNTIIY